MLYRAKPKILIKVRKINQHLLKVDQVGLLVATQG
jgi:hypothetical protein